VQYRTAGSIAGEIIIRGRDPELQENDSELNAELSVPHITARFAGRQHIEITHRRNCFVDSFHGTNATGALQIPEARP